VSDDERLALASASHCGLGTSRALRQLARDFRYSPMVRPSKWRLRTSHVMHVCSTARSCLACRASSHVSSIKKLRTKLDIRTRHHAACLEMCFTDKKNSRHDIEKRVLSEESLPICRITDLIQPIINIVQDDSAPIERKSFEIFMDIGDLSQKRNFKS